MARAELPLELLKDFKEDLKKIRADKKKQKDSKKMPQQKAPAGRYQYDKQNV